MLGPVSGVIQPEGVSPSQPTPATVLYVDLYGTTVVLELFGNIIAKRRLCGGYRVPIGPSPAGPDARQDKALATTPADALLALALPMLAPDHVTDPLNAYQL
jgi:hypothetical protein